MVQLIWTEATSHGQTKFWSFGLDWGLQHRLHSFALSIWTKSEIADSINFNHDQGCSSASLSLDCFSVTQKMTEVLKA